MKRSQVIKVMVVAAIIWFALLGHRDLIEPDEGRYAEIPREIVATGDWITPRLNDFKYFEKPMLQYWATAVGFTLFGQSNASARLWPALIAFLGAIGIWFMAMRLYGERAGFYAFVICISSLLYSVLGHILTLDMSVSVFVALGVGALSLAQTQRDNRPFLQRWMLFAWAALALALLSKGLIGVVLPAMAVVLYTLWERDWALWKHMHFGKGLLLFFAITAPWFITVSLRNPEFAEFFFIHEHFARYTSAVHERTAPFWFFVPYLLLGIVPWFFLVLKSLLKPGFKWSTKQSSGFNAERFLWVFVVAVFVFFSMGQSKLPPYILPMIPILAILAGKRLANDGQTRFDAWIMAALAVVFFALAWQVPRLADEIRSEEMLLNSRPWIIASALCWALGSAFVYKGNEKRPLFFAGAGLAALLAIQSLGWGYQTLAASRSNRDMAEAIRPHLTDNTPIYTARLYYYPYTIAFYLERNLSLVNYKGEMEMGIDLEPNKWIATDEEFIRRWKDGNKAVAIMSPQGYQDFKEMNLPMQIIFKGIRSLAVVTP